MAITTTLSRLKNYFIGWHTANYRTLHEFTDQITEDEPDGNKLVESKTIFRYIKDLLGDKDTPNENTIWGNIGKKCTSQGGNTLWANIYSLWNIIGQACSGTNNDPTDNYTPSSHSLWENICQIWKNFGKWSDGATLNIYDKSSNPKSIWGWLNFFDRRTDELIEHHKYLTQTCIIDSERIGVNRCSNHHIAFYRKGYYCFVHGWIYIKSPEVLKVNDAGEEAEIVFPISADYDWLPVKPASSVFLTFNNRLGSSVNPDDHFHSVMTDGNNYLRTNSVIRNNSALPDSDVKQHYHTLHKDDHIKTASVSNATGVNSVQINTGEYKDVNIALDRSTGDLALNKTYEFCLCVTGHNLAGKKLWVSGTYLCQERETAFGDNGKWRAERHNDNLHGVDFSKNMPAVGGINTR